LVEAAAAGLAALGVWEYGLTVLGLEVVMFGWISLALGLIDLEHQILPDVITYPSIILGLGFSFLGGWTTPLSSVIGAAVGAGLPIAVIVLYRWMRGEEGMGWGDVKYLAAIGAVVGVRDCVRILIVASVLGAAIGIGLIIAGRGSSKTALPFGTFLALAVLVWLFTPPEWRAVVPF
jgi:leader peptidase (prepilin peptidase)/N-methyltransferase